MSIPISRPLVRIALSLFDAILLAGSLASCVSLHAAPRPVTLACFASPESIFPGELVILTAAAGGLDPKLNAIYSWRGIGVTGSSVSATVATADLAPGSYSAQGTVKEGKKGKEGMKPWETANCSVSFTVKEFEPPTISCSADQNTIQMGDTSMITCEAVSPQNRPLTYRYSATAGMVAGSGSTVVYSSAGAPTGAIRITGTVTDDTGHTATANTNVTIMEPPAPPAPPEPPPPPAAPQFPWPPPQASFPSRVLSVWPLGSHMRTLGDIDAKLTAALDAKGYTDRSYYSVPGGFALITRLEQIDQNGISKDPPDRFSVELKPPSNFADYIFALFHANPGYYRVIVFIARAQPFAQGTKPASQSQVTSLLQQGVNVLPSAIASQRLTREVRCTALIYEFENPGIDNSRQANLLVPGTMDSVTQLRNAGLWVAFQAH